MPIIDMPLENLKMYEGRNPRPADFDEYWERAIAEMQAVDPEVELIPSDFKVPYAKCYDMYYTGVRGARIHAKLWQPVNAEKPHPAMLLFHGYGCDTGDWCVGLQSVAMGYTVVGMDCRGQGGSSEDVGGVKGTTLRGHIIRGLDDGPDNLLFRHIFLDTAELAKIVMAMPEVDENRVGVHGVSQGGGLSLACAALEPRIKRVSPWYPFLCDYQRVWEMDMTVRAYYELKDYFRHHDPRHERENEIFVKLGYIDCQWLASRISGEVLMATALMDDCCPPSTQFAAYNKITAKKNIVIYLDFGHEGLPGMGDRTFQFMAEL